MEKKICAATDFGICMHVNENLKAAQFKAILFMKINDIMTRTSIISKHKRDNTWNYQEAYSELPLKTIMGGTC